MDNVYQVIGQIPGDAMIRLGVTGTDTGVGKTFVSTVLLRLMRARGMRVAAMKPVETGVSPGD
ncbi:MAG TPA: dethiobiotin synthase, partial [Longimicrobium sp.]